MTMSMDYALATITGTYSYTVKEINEQGENNVSDIEYDPSVYTVTVNVDENMDMSITYKKMEQMWITHPRVYMESHLKIRCL